LQNGGFNLSPSKAEQESALVEALADVLWQARIRAVVSLALPVPESGHDLKSLGYDQLMRCLVLVQVTSKNAVQVQFGCSLLLLLDVSDPTMARCFMSMRTKHA
jgi:hypothetical protein